MIVFERSDKEEVSSKDSLKKPPCFTSQLYLSVTFVVER